MSTTASVRNFYVDNQGVEQPIRYKAADLVNVPAPVGYTWFKRNSAEENNDDLRRRMIMATGYMQSMFAKRLVRVTDSDDFYTCVKKKEAA